MNRPPFQPAKAHGRHLFAANDSHPRRALPWRALLITALALVWAGIFFSTT